MAEQRRRFERFGLHVTYSKRLDGGVDFDVTLKRTQQEETRGYLARLFDLSGFSKTNPVGIARTDEDGCARLTALPFSGKRRFEIVVNVKTEPEYWLEEVEGGLEPEEKQTEETLPKEFRDSPRNLQTAWKIVELELFGKREKEDIHD